MHLNTAAIPAGLEGLSDAEAAARQRVAGKNVITARHATIAGALLRQFASPFDGLLLAVAVLAFALHEATDAAIVLTIVVVSALLGARNEYSAEKILEKLRARITRQASVIRSGALRRIDVADLAGGIGENAAEVRSMICAYLEPFKGAEIQVVHTQETLMMARHVFALAATP